MELNITRFFNEATPRDYSASVTEIGSNAGADTWRAACDDYTEYLLLDTDDKRDAMRDHIRGFGAWDASEIAAMTNVALNALCIQMISGDIRESMHLEKTPIDWDAYENDENERHSIFKGIDGEIYYYLGD